jgi:hypothetical protein
MSPSLILCILYKVSSHEKGVAMLQQEQQIASDDHLFLYII